MEEITALIDRERKIIMDWSPKTGCTLAVKMFFRQLGILDEALAYHSWVHEYRMHVFSKQHPTTLEDLKNPEFYKFKIVRNPYSRVVSSYIHTMRKEAMHQSIKRKLLRWNANISFKKFVDYLGKIDIQQCDPHYSLQKKRFESFITPCFNRIIKLEDLENEIAKQNKEKNFKFDLTGITSHHHITKDNTVHNNVANEKWLKIKDKIPNYEFFYTDEIKKKVSEIYRADLEAYGYTYEEMLKNS